MSHQNKCLETDHTNFSAHDCTMNDWQRTLFYLTEELVDVTESQYIYKTNDELMARVQTHHLFIHEYALISNGTVSLVVDQEKGFATIEYTDDMIVLSDRERGAQDKTAYCNLMTDADEVVTTVDNGKITTRFIFTIGNKIFVEDHSAQIAEIRARIEEHKSKPAT